MDSETTYYMSDIDYYVCDNCGAYSSEVKDIPHYDTCKKGEAKKWEKYYKDNPLRDIDDEDFE